MELGTSLPVIIFQFDLQLAKDEFVGVVTTLYLCAAFPLIVAPGWVGVMGVGEARLRACSPDAPADARFGAVINEIIAVESRQVDESLRTPRTGSPV